MKILLSIARWTPLWLANWIRYLMLKIMKRTRMPDDNRTIIATAKHLIEEILLPSGFEVFKDKEFRQLTKFDQLPRLEQDRIFNELIVSSMLTAIFGSARAEEIVKPEDYHFWRAVHIELPRQFEYTLREFGSESKHVRLYRDLIKMRQEEYERLGEDVWKIWDEEETKFKNMPIIGREIVSWVHAVSIGTADHIKRGKLTQKDKLPRYLRWWLFDLNEQVGKFIKKL